MISLDEKSKLAARVLESYWNISKATIKMAQSNAASFGLTLQQMSILKTLLASPDLTLKELTGRLVSSKSTLSVNINGLVQAGLVIREIPKENRREVKLTLTDKGKELARRIISNAVSSRVMMKVLDRLSEEDVQSIVRINTEVLNHLGESPEPPFTKL
jgi:DNA-binding MarR family transcriptional regulator